MLVKNLPHDHFSFFRDKTLIIIVLLRQTIIVFQAPTAIAQDVRSMLGGSLGELVLGFVFFHFLLQFH